MVNIREALIPINEYSRPGKKLSVVRNTVWHYTANPGATANNHFIYFGKTMLETNKANLIHNAAMIKQYGKEEAERLDLLEEIRYASAHYFIDPKETVLIIPEAEVAYHANQANPYSIGVELCIEKDGTFHPNTVKQAVELGALLAKKYNQNPQSDFLRHYDVTGKICPKPWVDKPADWQSFKQAVKDKIKGVRQPMQLTNDQWYLLAKTLEGFYKKGMELHQYGDKPPITDYGWAERAYKQNIPVDELAWLIFIVLGRIEGLSTDLDFLKGGGEVVQ